MVFNVFFSFCFLLNHWPIVYIVLHCCFGRYFLCFWFIVALFTFSLVRVSFHLLTIMRIWVSTSTHYRYKPCTYIWRPLYSLPVDGIGHKTGTRQDQVKITRLLPQNSSGALAPWFYPNLIPAGLEPSKLNLDTSKYIISRRQVYLWVVRKGLINGYDMLLINQERGCSWGAFFTRF